MNKLIENPEWFKYIETPVYKGTAVKLDSIMAKRLKAFLRAKRMKTFKFEK